MSLCASAKSGLPRGNGLDFETCALGDGGDLDAGAGGERRAEGAGVGVVHGGEVINKT